MFFALLCLGAEAGRSNGGTRNSASKKRLCLDQIVVPITREHYFPVKFARRITNTPWIQRAIGVAAAEYLRLVWKTSRFTMEPPDLFGMYEKYEPVIIAMWHGQHFLLPFFRRHYRIKVLVSRHADGEINAIAAERLGIGTVRGSGDHARRFQAKGGVGAFRNMLELAG